MAEEIAGILAQHERWESNYTLGADYYCTGCKQKVALFLEELPEIEQGHRNHIAYSLAAAGYGKLEEAKAPEVRYATLTNGETELDEIVARNASVHLEAMDDNHWWMAIESGGTRYAVNL